jgi:hypothetical protein
MNINVENYCKLRFNKWKIQMSLFYLLYAREKKVKLNSAD